MFGSHIPEYSVYVKCMGKAMCTALHKKQDRDKFSQLTSDYLRLQWDFAISIIKLL